MKILKTESGKSKKGIIVTALTGLSEFEQLQGRMEQLCLFATQLFTERASYVKTGARHSMVKYVLVPTRQRAKLKLSGFDFDTLKCTSVAYRDSAYLIYKVSRKAAPKQPLESARDDFAPEL